MVTVDLCLYPSFHSPQSGKRVPTLKTILDGLIKREGEIVALSACHSMETIDTRFRDYMNFIDRPPEGYRAHSGDSRGWYSFTREDCGAKPLILVNSQIVRAYYNDAPVDVNVIGVSDIIKPTRDIDVTVNEARSKGGIVLLCNVGSSLGVDVGKAVEIYKWGGADAVQVRAGEGVSADLIDKGVKVIAVTGAHGYTLANTSHATFSNDLIENFSIKVLREEIKAGRFENHQGEISKFQRFWNRDRYIWISIPGHILAGGVRRRECLKNIGLGFLVRKQS